MSNEFEQFRFLPSDLQKEALREGEIRLQAQLQTAIAADQRALTWGGFLIASATAAIGGGVALLTKDKPEIALGFLALGFAVGCVRAAYLAIGTVTPSEFCFPGNRPALWLPDPEHLELTERRLFDVYQANRARHQSKMILENAKTAKRLALAMRASFRTTWRTIYLAGTLLPIVLLMREYTVREPTSEIVARAD